MATDHHKNAFDDGTKIKLFLYEEYLREWLPVFLKRKPPLYSSINIFDFFAGPGRDINGVEGSPLITINSLNDYTQDILDSSLNVNLFFNDENKKKIEQLENVIGEQNLEKHPYTVHLSPLDFKKAFEEKYHIMHKDKSANFLFLDQTGVKHITKQIFEKIINLPTTDFLFFISSSTFKRFHSHPDIKKYHTFSAEKFSSIKPQNIHREVADHYRGMIPFEKEYYLAPFSIKKPPNIYGLIFGSGNLLGLDKFLSRCWKIDPQRGEANYDIDGDNINPQRPSLFKELNKPRKLQLFERDLSEKILGKELQTNKEIYIYTLINGFLSQHAREVFKNMKSKKLLPRQSLPISYNSCIKKAQEQTIIYFSEK